MTKTSEFRYEIFRDNGLLEDYPWMIIPIAKDFTLAMPRGRAGDKLYRLLVDHGEVDLKEAFSAELILLVVNNKRTRKAHVVPVTFAKFSLRGDDYVEFFYDEPGRERVEYESLKTSCLNFRV